jgi:hypothetical protein
MYICRTIDSFIIGYAKQALSIFLVDLDLIMDVVSVSVSFLPRWSSSSNAASRSLVDLQTTSSSA